MFGTSTATVKDEDATPESDAQGDTQVQPKLSTISEPANSADKLPSGGTSPVAKSGNDEVNSSGDKKRRSSGVSRAKDMFSSAKQSLHLHSSSPSPSSTERGLQSPIQKLAKTDPALGVPHGSLNNSAGESSPGPHSTFRVGVTEDRNKKCRRTMEDTHAYLYNFLSTPAPVLSKESEAAVGNSSSDSTQNTSEPLNLHVVETDNGYFAIFDGHAGTFAADWCGKKLHLLLEDMIRRNPSTPIPELLDQTFTAVDQQLEKLPLKNSGCTAVIAVLRWEDRVPNSQSATGSAFYAPAAAAAIIAASESNSTNAATADNSSKSQVSVEGTTHSVSASTVHSTEARLRESASRQRVLYTANVGDARIVLCRNGRALRLSYDHKGSDENEGRRVANAGGLILNNRVNGVLAVTRALGDAYMKDLVTGHPYTTETVIQPDQDEFLILACDGLWDVCSDQEAVDLVRNVQDPQIASKQLVDHALARFSTDNLSCMIVRFDSKALKQRRTDSSLGVEVDPAEGQARISEADAIVEQAKKTLYETEGGAEHGQPEMIVEEDAEPGPEPTVEGSKPPSQSS